jgi:hypothetical protein
MDDRQGWIEALGIEAVFFRLGLWRRHNQQGASPISNCPLIPTCPLAAAPLWRPLVPVSTASHRAMSLARTPCPPPARCRQVSVPVPETRRPHQAPRQDLAGWPLPGSGIIYRAVPSQPGGSRRDGKKQTSVAVSRDKDRHNLEPRSLPIPLPPTSPPPQTAPRAYHNHT